MTVLKENGQVRYTTHERYLLHPRDIYGHF